MALLATSGSSHLSGAMCGFIVKSIFFVLMCSMCWLLFELLWWLWKFKDEYRRSCWQEETCYLMIPQQLDIIKRFWFCTVLGHHLSLIQRNERTSNDSLGCQVKVWRAFSSDRRWNHLNDCRWARCYVRFTAMCSKGKLVTEHMIA